MTLHVITDPALGAVRHGFFTRQGGASSGVFEGLNCGLGSSDLREAVAINRDRVRDWMGVAEGALVGMHQIHSADVVTVRDPSDGGARADGMVTTVPGIALAVLTADCLPILFAAPGCVGVAHAGWKGALAGIAGAMVRAMEGLGAKRDEIRAVIGPAISQANYEVGPDLREAFVAADPTAMPFFAPGHGDRFWFDLPGYGLAALRAEGIASANWVGACTYADPARFYSYRRATHLKEVDYGRLIGAIRL